MLVRVLHLVEQLERIKVVRVAIDSKMTVTYDSVSTSEQYVDALQKQAYDLVLASASSSFFDGLEALAYLRQHYPETPLLFVVSPEEKYHLLAVPNLDAWDVISTSELRRLPVSMEQAYQSVSYRRELEKAKALLLRSERSITIGRLMGSIAHEINNPLEAMANLLYLAQRNWEDQSGLTYVQMAEQELQRVGEITKQTLGFHRESKTPQEIRITDALESVLALYGGRLIQRKIEVIRQYRSEAPVLAYLGEIRQVFANLIGNAIDAMPDGGRLSLRVRAQTAPVPALYVTIADTGTGMSQEATKHIGELFYTTKGEAGTGLGMWVSQQILKKYGGSLQTFSSIREGSSGTVFRLRFRLSNTALQLTTDRQEGTVILHPRLDESRDDEQRLGGNLRQA